MPCSYGARLQRPLTKRGFGGLINRIGCGSADAASLNLTLSLATCSSVSDTFQRDRAEARNVAVGEPAKAVDVVRRFECDYHPGLGQSGPRQGELPSCLRGRSDRRPTSGRDSPGRTNGNAVTNPRIRA
jgi:hypothetical protein